MGKTPSDIQSLMIQRSHFPTDFTWGVATSAFQIEGAAKQDGRGPSIWDTFCETSGHIADNSTGLIACDHYNRLEEDLDLIASLGVTAYRFSVSWPRVQPLGTATGTRQALIFIVGWLMVSIAAALKRT